MEEKFQARLILEVIGRPAQNVTDALNALADRMAKEKGVKMLEKNIHPPVEVKEAKDLFTTFGEFLIECESMSVFFGIIFAYMPANIEIIRPDEILLRNSELTLVANKIIQRLHNYDAIARRLVVDNQQLRKQLGLPEPNKLSSNPAVEPKQEKKDKKKKATKSKKAKKK